MAMVTGLKSDAELCKEVFTFAVNFVLHKVRKTPKDVAKSYALGFVDGLKSAYAEQQDEHPEWGLVVVKPEKVREYEDSLNTRSVKTKAPSFNPLAYLRGQVDGQTFDAKKILGEAN